MTPTVRPLTMRELGIILARMKDEPPWAPRRALRWLDAIHRNTGVRICWKAHGEYFTTVAAIRDAVPGLGEKIASAADVDDLGERVDGCETRLARHDSDITSLATAVAAQGRRIAALESGTMLVGQPVTGIRAKLTG